MESKKKRSIEFIRRKAVSRLYRLAKQHYWNIQLRNAIGEAIEAHKTRAWARDWDSIL